MPASRGGAGAAGSAMHVDRCEPISRHMYMAPGAEELTRFAVDALPPKPPGCLRVVCVSDTHNEHAGLRLPPGDVLIHAGDVLTESGIRHQRPRRAAAAAASSLGLGSAASCAAGIVAAKVAGGEDNAEEDKVGAALLKGFAEWLGAQPFAHKVIIGGNHDSALQRLGRERVQEILSKACSHGEVAYLEESEANVGGLRVWGSPYAHYSSHNCAFSSDRPRYKIPTGVHVVITHMPAVLPSRGGLLKQHDEIAEPALASGALLHVSGHCHWASGLYFARSRADGGARRAGERSAAGGKLKAGARPSPAGLPCVVASVCCSSWLSSRQLLSAEGQRGDPRDAQFGGYNLTQPGIVVDLPLPADAAAAPVPRPLAAAAAAAAPERLVALQGSDDEEEDTELERAARLAGDAAAAAADPDGADGADGAALLFCPPTDEALAEALAPGLAALFGDRVIRVETAEEGVRLVAERRISVCIAKLGHKGNLGHDVLAALRSAQGSRPRIIVHSSTASRDEQLQERWRESFGVELFTHHGLEEQLLEYLRSIAGGGARGPAAFSDPAPAPSSPPPPPPRTLSAPPPRALIFGPPNDPGFLKALLPRLKAKDVEVDVVSTAKEGVRALAASGREEGPGAAPRRYCACVAKLGTKGNVGAEVIAAFREQVGREPFVAVHSATAAAKGERERSRMGESFGGVDLFVKHGQEELLADAVARAALAYRASVCAAAAAAA